MKKICSEGHAFNKSSDCPTCPRCEQERRPTDSSFLSQVSAPARRALDREGITSLVKLSKYSALELLSLHGVGPGTIPRLTKALAVEGLRLKDEK